MNRSSTSIWLAGLLLATCVLASSEPANRHRVPPGRLDFTYDDTWSGRDLTAGEKAVVQRAIDSIRTPPPDSITYTDANGNPQTVSCSALGAWLQIQLNGNTMQAETLNQDVDGGEYWDEINISDDVLADAQNTGNTDYLEELLIHEGTHKGQPNNLPEDDTEIPAYAAELAYKDSMGMTILDAEYRACFRDLMLHRVSYTLHLPRRRAERSWINRFVTSYLPDIFPSEHKLITHQFGDTEYREFPLGPLEVSDMVAHENYFGPGVSMVLLIGNNRLGGSHVTALQMQEGMVTGPVPWWTLPLPPGFYSMNYSSDMQSYFLVDTLDHSIYRAPDSDGDLLPDGPILPWATMFQFPQLANMLSVKPTYHPGHGFGLIVNESDEHFSRWIPAHEVCSFLVDMDGAEGADAAFPCRRLEFVNIQPRITDPFPWPGDMTCTVFGTWQHPIEIWTTDPLGQVFIEPIGVTVLGDDIVASCPLLRPLMHDEYILAVDAVTDRHISSPFHVSNPTPKALTIFYDVTHEAFTLDWQDVPGATSYRIEVSFDGWQWEDVGFIAVESRYVMPDQHLNYLEFRVIAQR